MSVLQISFVEDRLADKKFGSEILTNDLFFVNKYVLVTRTLIKGVGLLANTLVTETFETLYLQQYCRKLNVEIGQNMFYNQTFPLKPLLVDKNSSQCL